MEALSLPYLAMCVLVFLVANAWLLFRPQRIQRKRGDLDQKTEGDVAPMARQITPQSPRARVLQRPLPARNNPPSRPRPR